MERQLKVEYPGLIIEPLPSGNKRYRVRLEGSPGRHVTLLVGPNHKQFTEAYHAARRGIQLQPEADPIDVAINGSVSWLTYRYEEYLQSNVDAGLSSPLTLHDRKRLFQRLRDRSGEYSLSMPTKEVIKIRDEMNQTPAYADNMIKAIRAMFKWAVETGITNFNPSVGVGKIDQGKGGAIPWTVDDLKKYRNITQKAPVRTWH